MYQLYINYCFVVKIWLNFSKSIRSLYFDTRVVWFHNNSTLLFNACTESWNSQNCGSVRMFPNSSSKKYFYFGESKLWRELSTLNQLRPRSYPELLALCIHRIVHLHRCISIHSMKLAHERKLLKSHNIFHWRRLKNVGLFERLQETLSCVVWWKID